MSTALTNAKQLWTTDPQRTFSGSAPTEAGGIMEIVMDSTVYTVTIAADGSWSWQPPFPLAEGPHNLSVRTIDRAGNVGAPSLFIVNVDLTAPDQPIIINALDDNGAATGLIGSGQQSDDRTPTLRGIAEPDSLVHLYNAKNEVIGSVKTNSNGYWEITPTLGEGTHTFYAKATDGRGHESEASHPFQLTIADDAPPVSAKTEIKDAIDDTGSAPVNLKNGAVTIDYTPTLHGSAPADSEVRMQYRLANGKWIDGGLASLTGDNWSWTPNPGLGQGEWQFRANSGSGWTDEFTLKIDLQPQITYALDDNGASTGQLTTGAITDDKTPTLMGKGVPHSLILVEYALANGSWKSAGSAVVDANGNWLLVSPQLSGNGQWGYRACTDDGASKSSWTPKFVLNFSADADKAPSITQATDDTGSVTGKLSNGSLTDDKTPTLQGTGAPGAVIEIQYGLSTNRWSMVDSVVVDASGNWKFTPQLTSDGIWEYRSRSTNGIGKSDWSKTFILNVGDEADNAPEITHAVDNVGSVQGDIQHNGRTDDKTPTLTGKGVPGAIIEIEYGKQYESWKSAGSTKVDANGNWSMVSPELSSNGIWVYHARSTNGINKSDWTGKFVIELGADKEVKSAEQENTLPGDALVDDTTCLDLANLPVRPGDSSVINMDNSTAGILTLNAENLLQHGEKSLFINDDKTQLVIMGDKDDTVKLTDLIPGTDISASWSQLNGSVTVAGIHYQVYNHGDAELLVQEGVKVELI